MQTPVRLCIATAAHAEDPRVGFFERDASSATLVSMGVVPENSIRADWRDEAESAHHPSDACDPPAACDVCPVQVAAPA
jgi:hypothetical protein